MTTGSKILKRIYNCLLAAEKLSWNDDGVRINFHAVTKSWDVAFQRKVSSRALVLAFVLRSSAHFLSFVVALN
jgi:hypothetical protein